MNKLQPWLFLLGLLCLPPSHAQSAATAQDLAARYPLGSIHSVEQADAALAMVVAERSLIAQRHAQQEAACYPRFWVSSCLEQAADARRVALTNARRIEVEAARFKREAKVLEHDKAMAERRQLDAENAPQRMIKEQDFARVQAEREAAEAKAVADKQAASAREEETRQKTAQHQAQIDAKMKRAAKQQAAKAATRADKEAAFAKKQQDAKARQEELAQRREEHEKKAAEKAEAEKKAAEKAASAPRR
jgi:hypothetical protein